MRVCFDIFLDALGCDITGGIEDLQQCPVCRNTSPSLHILNPSDIYLFHCAACAFEGDPVQLLAKVRHITISQALDLFKPGNEFYHTLAQDCADCHQQEYINHWESQAIISNYVKEAHQALYSTDGQIALNELARKKLIQRKLPDSFGFVTETCKPPQLRQLDQINYTRNPHFTYTYYYADKVTGIAVRPLDNLNRQDYIMLLPRGVYNPGADDHNLSEIYIAQNEYLATAMYSLAQHYSSKPLSVVCAQDLPLPYGYKQLKDIYLLSQPDGMLALENAFKYLAADPIITGIQHKPNIRVLDLYESVPTPTMIKNATATSSTLHNWIARALLKLYREQGSAEIVKLLSNIPPINKHHESVVAELNALGAKDELISLVKTRQAYYGDCAILTNGYTVYRLEDEIKGAPRPGLEPDTCLSNVAMRTLSVLTLHNKQQANAKRTLQYKMWLKTKNEQPIIADLLDKDFKTAATLQRAIIAAYAEQGKDIHVALTPPSGCTWSEIRAAFNDQPEIENEVTQYGVTPDLTVELPNLTIKEQGTKVVPQVKVIKEIHGKSIYGGVRKYYRKKDSINGFCTLWTTGDIGHAAMAGCISHLFFCILQALACRKQDQPVPVRHMLLTDPLLQTWEPIHKSFTRLLCGSEYSYTVMPHHLHHYSGLGSLPLPIRVYETGPKVKRLYIYDSPIIGLVNTQTVKKMIDSSNITFMALAHAPDPTLRKIPEQLFYQLKYELMDILCFIIQHAWDIPAESLITSELPALDTYNLVADLLQVKASSTLSQLLATEYIDYSVSVLDRFFLALQHILKNSMYTTMEGIPTPHKERTASVYITSDYAIIDRALIKPINTYLVKQGYDIITDAMIRHGLREHKYTYPNPAWTVHLKDTRFWCMPRRIWQTRVVGAQELRILRPDTDTYQPEIQGLKLA